MDCFVLVDVEIDPLPESPNQVGIDLGVTSLVALSNKDFLHKLTTRLVRENQTIAVEDLAVKNMVKIGNLLSRSTMRVGVNWSDNLSISAIGMVAVWSRLTDGFRVLNDVAIAVTWLTRCH